MARTSYPTNVVFFVELAPGSGVFFGDELHAVVVDEEGAGAEASVLGCGAAEGVTDGEAGPEGAVEAGGAEEGADSSSEGAGEEAGSEAGAEEGATSELDATIEGDNVLAAGLLDMLTTTIAQPKRPRTQSKERLGRGSEQGTEN